MNPSPGSPPPPSGQRVDPARSKAPEQLPGSPPLFGSWELELGRENVDANCLRWSDEMFRIAGLPPGAVEVSNQLFFRLAHPDDHAAIRHAVAAAIQEHGQYSLVHRLIRPDGEVRTVHEMGQLFYDPKTGRPLKMIGTTHDVTDQVQVETRLREHASRLSAIAEAQHDLATTEAGADELMDRIAAMAQRLVGADGAAFELVEGEDMVYRAASGLAAGHVGLRLKLNASLSGQAAFAARTLRCDDSETDPRVDAAECRRIGLRSMIVTPLRGETGPVGVIKVMSARPGGFAAEDVASVELLAESVGTVLRRKRAEQALRDQEARLRVMADSLPVLIHYVDSQEHYRYANATARQWHEQGTGQFSDEILGHSLRSIHSLESYRTIKPYVDRALAGEVVAFDSTVQVPGGQVRHRHVVYAPHRGETGAVLGFYVLVSDITERKRGEKELSRINRALQMLSSCNSALIRMENEHNLLNEICRIAVEIGGYRMAWVGYAQEDGERLIQPMAHAGKENGYLSAITLTWQEDDPRGRGPAGQAIRTGKAAICEDVTRLATFQWLDEARSRGYSGVICLPLRDRERTFGLLALYSAEVHQAGADEVEHLQDLADNLAFGISGIRSRQERRRMRNAVLKVAAGVSASTGTHFFEELVSYMADALGAEVGAVAMTLPERRSARTVAMIVDGQIQPNIEYDLADTPCALLEHEDLTIVPRNVQQRFPKDPMLVELNVQAYAGTVLLDSTGAPLGIMAVLFREPLQHTDFIVSTLKIFAARAAAELERQRQDARVLEQASLLDKARDAILVRDLDHHITYWNKSAEQLYGWSAAEALGRKVNELLYSDQTQFDEIMRILMHAGEWIGEIRQITRARAEVLVEGRWTLVRDEQGRPAGVLAINTDITERKKIETQFLRAQRMESIGTLAGGIAHDLNNVLAPILMAIDLLRMSTRDEGTLSILSTIKLSAKRGADMVQQVLSFARGMDGQRIRIDPRNVIRDIQQIVHDTFPKNIHLHARPAPDLGAFNGDPTQVHQVLLNLCVNARDAMLPQGGPLEISAERLDVDDSYASMTASAKPGTYIAFKVADSGEGMPKDIQDKIFDPFFTTKELGKGTGLGLSTVLAIVKSHGGFIHVYSEPGHGTTFKVFFPADTGSGGHMSVENTHETLPRGQGELILIVDDEAAVRTVTKQTLEAFGYRIITAGDGAEAIALYAQHQQAIALVLTDMMMPVMDGPATIQVLMRMNPAVKIIAASGLNANSAVARAVGLGVKHFLPKPYTTQTVLVALKQVIAGTQAGP